MPAQNGVRRDDTRDFAERLATDRLAPHSKTTPLRVSQPQAPISELFAQDPILRDKVLDHRRLAAAKPAGNGENQELKVRRVHGPNVHRPPLPKPLSYQFIRRLVGGYNLLKWPSFSWAEY
jgi:hypothetical protein